MKFITRARVCRYCDGGEIDGGGRTASHSTQGRTEEGEEMEEGEVGGGRKELGGARVDG